MWQRRRESSREMTNSLWMSAMKADSLIDFLSPLTAPSSPTSSPYRLSGSEQTELWFSIRSQRCGETLCCQVGFNSMQRWYLCPFKTKPLVHPDPVPRLFPFLSSSHPSHPTSRWSLHFYVFNLWRCCIRYTVILNEQWVCAFFFSFILFISVLFCSFLSLWSSLESVSLWSLMKCTAQLCLWNQECILACVCVRVCVCVCRRACAHMCLNENRTLKSMSVENKVNQVFVCKLTVIWSKQHRVCLHADL